MFHVHATKKVLDRCGGATVSDAPTSTVLGDWYVTALFWKPQVALFVNESTRLPVFVPLAPAAGLVPRFVGALGVVLDAHGIDPRFIDAELAEMTEYCLVKTANRSVVGTMNDFAALAEFDRVRGGADLVALSVRLAGTPCGPLRTGLGFPDLELKTLVDRSLELG